MTLLAGAFGPFRTNLSFLFPERETRSTASVYSYSRKSGSRAFWILETFTRPLVPSLDYESLRVWVFVSRIIPSNWESIGLTALVQPQPPGTAAAESRLR